MKFWPPLLCDAFQVSDQRLVCLELLVPEWTELTPCPKIARSRLQNPRAKLHSASPNDWRSRPRREPPPKRTLHQGAELNTQVESPKRPFWGRPQKSENSSPHPGRGQGGIIIVLLVEAGGIELRTNEGFRAPRSPGSATPPAVGSLVRNLTDLLKAGIG